MADKLKSEMAGIMGIDSTAYQAAIASVNTAKERAAEHTGKAGAATNTFCDEQSITKEAFTFIAKMSRKDPEKRETVLSELIRGAALMGWFDQDSLLESNDLVGLLKSIVGDADAGVSGKPAGEPIEQGQPTAH